MPEPAGPAAVVYGDLGFGLLWAVAGAANMLTDLRADRLHFGRRGGHAKADRPILAGESPLMWRLDAGSHVPRDRGAAQLIEDMPCRVTTAGCRMRRPGMAARGADIGVRRSR